MLKLHDPSLPISFLLILPAQATHCHSPNWPTPESWVSYWILSSLYPLPNVFSMFMFLGITINAVLNTEGTMNISEKKTVAVTMPLVAESCHWQRRHGMLNNTESGRKSGRARKVLIQLNDWDRGSASAASLAQPDQAPWVTVRIVTQQLHCVLIEEGGRMLTKNMVTLKRRS